MKITTAYSSSLGGAILVDGGSLTLSNVVFDFNHAFAGGAIAAINGASLNVTGCTFIQNIADNGSAIYIDSDGNISISSSVFIGHEENEESQIYIKNALAVLSGNALETGDYVYLESGSVNAVLTFMDRETVKAEYGERITLNATVRDDNGNPIKGGSLTFTVNGEPIGEPFEVDGLIQIDYIAPQSNLDLVISGVYSLGRDLTFVNGIVHTAHFTWFIEGADRYESLSDAVMASMDGDVIYGLPGTYDVRDLDVNKNITIKANELGSIILNGNGNRIMNVYANVILDNLTFINGSKTNKGGFIDVEKGSLIINNSVFKDSEAVCPDKICMDFGEIHYNTEMIVCRPGSIVVLIENGDVSELDAVGQ